MKKKQFILPKNTFVSKSGRKKPIISFHGKTQRFKAMLAGRGGWCEWVFPMVNQNFLFKCCDCGLVHEMQFRAFVESDRDKKNGTFTVVQLPKEVRVMFRARRELKNKKSSS